MLFFAGLAGAAYETVTQRTDRPQLLVLFAAMMGLPAMLRGDERKETLPPAPPLHPAPPDDDTAGLAPETPKRRRPIRVRQP